MAGFQRPLTSWSQFSENQPTLNDKKAGYFHMLGLSEKHRPYLTAKDRLAIGWAKALNARVSDVQRSLDALKEGTPMPTGADIEAEACVLALIDKIKDGNHKLDAVIQWLATEIGNDGYRLDYLFKASQQLYRYTPWEPFARVCQDICGTYAWTSWFTDCGQLLPWLDTENACVGQLTILPHEFPNGFDETEYWSRQFFDLSHEVGRILTGSDVPISPKELWGCADAFPRTDNLAETQELGNDFLDDALANKQWTIPWGAVVDLQFGPFRYIELHEIGENVFFAFRTEKNETMTAAVCPDLHYCSFAFPRGVLGRPDDTREREIDSTVKLLLSAIVRDFWVVENRESVFAHGTAGESDLCRKADSTAPRTVYLPRIRYNHVPSADTARTNLGYPERRLHMVAAHFRRSGGASEQQIILARRYGFDVPQGFTFVRPHERGGVKRDVVYRSRTALQSLYTVNTAVVGSKGPVRWFQFERDVYSLMAALGFTVEHVAAGRHGDRGVDVFATKGTDLDRVNWIIQCKCFHPQKKIGPSVVRELAGVLAKYPRGTRGMIATTCRFTAGAKEEAEASDIRLIDGAEFAQLLHRAYGPNTPESASGEEQE
jgi:hypothetical protein